MGLVKQIACAVAIAALPLAVGLYAKDYYAAHPEAKPPEGDNAVLYWLKHPFRGSPYER